VPPLGRHGTEEGEPRLKPLKHMDQLRALQSTLFEHVQQQRIERALPSVTNPKCQLILALRRCYHPAYRLVVPGIFLRLQPDIDLRS